MTKAPDQSYLSVKNRKAAPAPPAQPPDYNPQCYDSFTDAITAYQERHQGNPDFRQYVLVFAHAHLYQDSPRHALVVRKRAGSMHAGLLNLPGGKIEPGERPTDAALREFQEETGHAASQPQVIGAIINGPMDADKSPFLVYIYRVCINPGSELSYPADQPASWELIEHARGYKFVSNLAVILPLIAANIIGFIHQDKQWAPWCSCITTILPHDMADAAGTKKKKVRFTT